MRANEVSYSILSNISHYSFLKALSKPKDIIERCAEVGLSNCALTDYDSVAGCVEFVEAAEKSGIKPILGCKIGISSLDATIHEKYNEDVYHITLLCETLEGWYNLIRIISKSNEKENFYGRPRLSLNQLGELPTKGLICLSGDLLLPKILTDIKAAYRAEDYTTAKTFANKDWQIEGSILLDVAQEIFGKESVYLDIDRTDNNNYVASMLADAQVYLANKHKIPTINGASYRYPRPPSEKRGQFDSFDFATVLTAGMKTTFDNRLVIANQSFPQLVPYLKSANSHIPNLAEVKNRNKEAEISRGNELAARIEKFSIFNLPSLPTFPCPNGHTPETYLRELARDGWKRKLSHITGAENKKVYGERFEKEFKIISEVGLSSYFLIVQDFVNKAKQDGQFISPGRGSSSGCLISYLLNITEVNPIPYGLIFERFYNPGRNTPGKISWPDIDVDFPIKYREAIFNYVKDKYGRERVAHIMTFQRIQGRGALKDVLRVHNRAGNDLMNRITKYIPEESKITDELQEMRQADEHGEASIIQWALENNKNDLAEWCILNEDGTCSGNYAAEFMQAIRIEGTKKSYGKHASGIIIAKDPLAERCPMIYDERSGEPIIGLYMGDVEKFGLIKMDCLSLNTLDKIMGVFL